MMWEGAAVQAFRGKEDGNMEVEVKGRGWKG